MAVEMDRPRKNERMQNGSEVTPFSGSSRRAEQTRNELRSIRFDVNKAERGAGGRADTSTRGGGEGGAHHN